MTLCTNVLFLRILSYFQLAMQFIRFVVPIVLIVKTIFDFYKNVISQDPASNKDTMSTVIKRVIAAIIVFLTPTLVNLVMLLVENTTGQTADYQSCLVNIENIEYYEQLSLKEQEKEEKEKNESLLQKAKDFLSKQIEVIKNNILKSNTASAETLNGTTVGQKYNLTDDELRDIAKICQAEQGSAAGAAAEASLMANRFELFANQDKYGTGASGLHKYVLECGWWNPAKTGSYKSVNLKDDILNAVREVLVMGNRTLPLYIDEHDCWFCNTRTCANGNKGDICYLELNGQTISDKSSITSRDSSVYVSNQTVIKTVYGATYTFYTFPAKTSDPFGYTANAKKKFDSLNN